MKTLFKKLMARFGKGAAKVDLVLDKNQFRLGETIQGKLVVEGGEAEQKINKIDILLMVAIRHDETESVHTVATIPVHEAFTIHPGERKELPFNYSLPFDLLISGNHVVYFFSTNLDIAGGLDQKDRDYIEIVCPQPLQMVLDALSRLGFREKHESRKFNGHGQEFELFPTDFLQGQAEELEFIAAIQPDGVHLLVELDLYSYGDEKEVKREVFIPGHLLESEEELVKEIKGILEEMANYGTGGYYHDSHHYFKHGHHGHGSSGLSGAIGGFAAGVIGTMVVNEVIDELSEDDEEEELEDFFEDED